LLPPPSTPARGLVYQWSFFAYTEVQARLVQLRMADSPEAAEAAAAALREALDVVAAALEGRDFLVEDRFSVADVLVGAILGAVRRLGLAELPAEVSRYLDALEARPAKQRSDARNPVPATPA
jgi:glutathione S-transferase